MSFTNVHYRKPSLSTGHLLCNVPILLTLVVVFQPRSFQLVRLIKFIKMALAFWTFYKFDDSLLYSVFSGHFFRFQFLFLSNPDYPLFQLNLFFNLGLWPRKQARTYFLSTTTTSCRADLKGSDLKVWLPLNKVYGKEIPRPSKEKAPEPLES